jgi:hypothetical protein
MEQISTMVFQTISSSALLIIIYIFYGLSRRLGEAMQLKPYYHLYSIGFAFILLSIIVQINFIFNSMTISQIQNPQIIVLIYLLLATGVTFSIIACLKYWGWLLKEIF